MDSGYRNENFQVGMDWTFHDFLIFLRQFLPIFFIWNFMCLWKHFRFFGNKKINYDEGL